MDQKYQHSMSGFVTASARADSIRESLAGQQSDIHSAGPEPERATVTEFTTVESQVQRRKH